MFLTVLVDGWRRVEERPAALRAVHHRVGDLALEDKLGAARGHRRQELLVVTAKLGNQEINANECKMILILHLWSCQDCVQLVLQRRQSGVLR